MTQNKHTADSGNGFNRRTILKTVGVSAAAAAGVAGMNAASAAAGTYTGESYGGRYYGKYVPSSYDGSEAVPLVMMLHGCSQNGDGFKNETQMNQVAEQEGFIAVYPEETEGIYSCWNWFEDSNTLRGQGQVQELAEGIVGQVESNENIHSDRIYVAGFSAGAYMVPNLLVEYADVFAAGGIHSGGQYDIAESQSEGNQVIGSCSTGSSADPVVEGEHAYDRMEQLGIDDYPIPTIVFHGTDDGTVSPCQGEIAAEQATVTNDLILDDTDDGGVDYSADDTNTGSGSSLSYTEYEYEDPKGRDIVEHYLVDGMTHAWSGGSSGGSYTAPGGPEASQILWNFFSRWDNALNDAPTADITASSTNVSTGDTVDFDGSGSADPDGSIASYEWDFGDGTTATGATASHSYSSGGVYDVTLTVTDGKGATGTATVSITADEPGNDAPSVDIQASATSITEGDTVDFDGSGSSDVDGSISSYEWDFTNDGTTDTSGAQVSHTYDTPGTFDAKLTVVDNDGGVSSATVTIDVGEFNGYCGTEYPYVHEDNGRAVSQSDGSYEAVGSGDDLGFGGSKVTLKETSAGYYEKVSSCDDSGDGGSNTAPSASFSASSTTVTTGDSVDVDGSGSSDSDGSISSYEWDFGDGATATGSTASHSYSSSGDYTVTLTVTDDDGATDSTSTTITVESSGGSSSCTTATLSDHVDAGRAYYSWGYYYATGSGQYLGFSGSTTVSLKETSDGYYEEVSSC